MTIKIETDFNVGDKVFFMQNNSIKSSVITGIFVDGFNAHLTDYEIKVSYWLRDMGSDRIFPGYLFLSKENLIKTL